MHYNFVSYLPLDAPSLTVRDWNRQRKGKFHELKHDECAASDERTAPRWRGKSIARLSFSRISCDRSSNSHLRPLPPPSVPPPPRSIHHRRLSTYPPRRLQTRSITVFARRHRRGKIVRKPRVIHQSNAVLVDLARKIRRPPLSPRELQRDEGLSLTLSIMLRNTISR